MHPAFLRADELGVRLEMVAGLPIWEPHPVYKHQKAVDRIRATISKAEGILDSAQEACECIHTADVYVSFPDGSLKRPDISLYTLVVLHVRRRSGAASRVARGPYVRLWGPVHRIMNNPLFGAG